MSLVGVGGETAMAFGFTGFFKKHLGTDSKGEMASALCGGAMVAPFVSATDCVCIQQQRFGGTMAATVPRIIREYGVSHGIFRGLTACVVRDSLYVGGLLGTAPLLRQWLVTERGWNVHAAETVACTTSGVVVGFLTCPFDAVSTSMKGDLDRKVYRGFLNTLRQRAAAGPATMFGGALWRSVFISISIGLANAVSTRLEPYIIAFNRSAERNNRFDTGIEAPLLGRLESTEA